MGERKVINKYIPWDFDPTIIPKRVKPKNDQIKIRMMVPMTIQCTACGEFIYKGKKFNARKEDVAGELYLGLKIFRFYIRCPRCAKEITIKTDPKNSDYVCETGATRNFEAWREERTLEEEAHQKKIDEEDDAMKALESRTFDSKAEMELLDDLEDIRAINAQNQAVEPEDLLSFHAKRMEEQEQKQNEEDERLIQEVFHKRKLAEIDSKSDSSHAPAVAAVAAAATPRFLQLHDDIDGTSHDEDESHDKLKEEKSKTTTATANESNTNVVDNRDSSNILAPAPKRQKSADAQPAVPQKTTTATAAKIPKKDASSSKKPTGVVVCSGTGGEKKKPRLVNY